ncbi:sulfotransferase [Rhodoligotrophos defluvii]|uniref:sulfotransferase n=1 Tax=Rhodoligotrophos defluvii TaxID=2561934 RepID=UPI00148582E8|nr:sulfotransferase [Rhodoligotrophos defluvii]
MKQQQAAIVAIPSAAWLESAVLTYGPRKAGTTLLQNLLDGGDQLFAYPAELKLKSLVRHPLGADPVGHYAETSRIPQIASPHFAVERYRQAWNAARSRRDWHPDLRELICFDLATVYDLCTNRPRRPSGWCAKDVGGDTDAIMQAWRRMFPEGRAIFIVRDPLMITRAVLQDRRRKSIRLPFRRILYETLDPLRVVASQAKYLTDSDVLVISYEHLVRDPKAVMGRVADFLGIDWFPNLAVPTIFGEPVVVRTASRAERSVFHEDRIWTDGLTWREKLIVATVHALAQLRSRYRVDYNALRRQVLEQMRAKARAA